MGRKEGGGGREEGRKIEEDRGRWREKRVRQIIYVGGYTAAKIIYLKMTD